MSNKYKVFISNHNQLLKDKEKEHDTIVVNAYAGAGAGKTTACLEICAMLKKNGYVAEYVSEYAKDLVWDENFTLLDGSQEHQFEILNEQLKRMDRLYGKVDFIVTDAPILLNQIYNNEITEDYKDMLKELNSQYSNFNFFVDRDTSSFEKEGRLQNLDESIQKDNEIKKMLSDNDLYFESYSHKTLYKVVPNVMKFYENSKYITKFYRDRKENNMPKYFTNKQKEEWITKSKEMEKKCAERVKEIAENYVRDPAKIAEALVFGSKFYDYSVRNTQLIYSQNPYAQYVQSFPAWKKMGYNIKKGEHGMNILVPVKTTLLKIDGEVIKLSEATKQQQKDYQDGKIEGFVSTRFKIGTVFDIAQTTFPPEKYPELFSVGYPSETHEDICKGLMDYAEKFVYCNVKVEDLSSITLRGYYSRNEKEIVLNSSLQGTQKLSTMAHELGHAIRHNIPNELSTSRREFEADAISVMIESGFGLPITDARKDHLVNHYNKFREELESELGDKFSDEALEEKINDVLASVTGTYRDCIDDINACVEQYISHEKLMELIAENQLDNTQEMNPETRPEKALEQDRQHELSQEKVLVHEIDMDEPELEL